jgi:hypothetical protein
MQREEVIRLIREALPEFRAQYRVAAISLIGSTARGDAREDSDVDVLADWDEAPTLDEFMELKFALEGLLGRSVDLLDRAGLKPRWRAFVERDALLVA